jgi:hypothetical protein
MNESHGKPAPVSRKARVFLGTAGAKIFGNHIYIYYIRILLTNRVRMIYICCIKYVSKARVGVLAVGNNELAVRDDDGRGIRRLPR